MSDAPAPKKAEEDTPPAKIIATAIQPNPTGQRWAAINLAEQLREAVRLRSHSCSMGSSPTNFTLGHLLNKVLKDFVVRSSDAGASSDLVPGWDCHGLLLNTR